MKPHFEMRNLLLIGHPGHELRLYGCIARARPLVCILTDGSGSKRSSRIQESASLLRRLGAQIGPIWGEFTDRQIYEHILERNTGVFERLCDQMAELIVEQAIDRVVSDAIEGYNPTHDLCEVLARNAVAIAGWRRRQTIQHYTVPLTGNPQPDFDRGEREYLKIALSAAECLEKLETARTYARRAGSALYREVEDAIEVYGEEAFACEYLFPAAKPCSGPERRFEHEKPHYESYGEEQVLAGLYQFVIRFRQHMRPLMDQLDAMGLAAHPHGVA